MEQPFLEHPTGEHETALEAMEHAIRTLRALPEWKQWIMFCAQGAGASDESIHCAEVRLLQDKLDGIRSFPDEDDYAFGAEWLDPTGAPNPGSE